MANANTPDFVFYKTTEKTVSTNAELILRENDKRRYLIVQNVGSVDVHLAFGDTRGPAVSTTAGLRLRTNEALELTMGSQNVSREKVYATAASSNSSLLITEGAYDDEFAAFAPPAAGASSSSSSSSSSS